MPIWPTWWWPQALMQPEILILRAPLRARGAALPPVSQCPVQRGSSERLQGAVIHAGASDDIRGKADICRPEPRRQKGRMHGWQVCLGHMGQDHVLLVADAQLVIAIFAGQIRQNAHLRRCGIAQGLPWALIETVTIAWSALRWGARFVSAQARNTGSWR